MVFETLVVLNSSKLRKHLVKSGDNIKAYSRMYGKGRTLENFWHFCKPTLRTLLNSNLRSAIDGKPLLQLAVVAWVMSGWAGARPFLRGVASLRLRWGPLRAAIRVCIYG
jgi:hypothetical protein